MDFIDITDEATWTAFQSKHNNLTFLQTWEWGEMQRRLGYDILRRGITEHGRLVSTVLVVKVRAKRGAMLFVPQGPTFERGAGRETMGSHLKLITDSLVAIAQKENYAFIRIAPILNDVEENRNLFLSLGYRTAPIYMHAERVWSVNLTPAEDVLLANMRKTTRYLIRRAPKDGVSIVTRVNKEALNDFWSVYEETARRERFVPFSRSYLRNEYEVFARTGNVFWLFGFVGSQKKPSDCLAAAMVIFTKNTGFYHQGASLHSKEPVAYLMQWEAMREAKKRGCLSYNFWGILEKGRSPSAWQGLTLFKQGFGGFQTDYVSTQDYIVSPHYWYSYLYEQYLMLRRGVK